MKRHESHDRSPSSPELLSPAGSPESGYAALGYGADAVYAGLESFSARADAVNFTPDELDGLAGYAHSLDPPRRVYVAVNTLVLDGEFGELVGTLGLLAELGVDAVIVQDWGVYRAAHRHFPGLRLHASTQMAVHSAAGVETLARMGFARVTLARELTLDEIRTAASVEGVETECFVHGALCYSYSGLCLFSSHVHGRSGNRGRCAYSCRGSFCPKGGPEDEAPSSASTTMPFSMKDLALPDRVGALGEAGVAALKIEGRMKSPTYVAAVTDFYRRLLDGTLDPCDRPSLEEDLRTTFSRPWTELYLAGGGNRDVVDSVTVGHRGSQIGTVESIVLSVGRTAGDDEAYLRFETSRRLELHDGLQIELPGLYRPFGFAVDKLRVAHATRRAKRKQVHEAPAGSFVEVALPAEFPDITPGTPVFCSSSQEVKQRYRRKRPKPGGLRSLVELDVEIELSCEAVTARASALSRSTGERVAVERSRRGPFERAREPEKMAAAVRGAFGRLGATRFEPGRFAVRNPEARFVPVSVLGDLRRSVTSAVDEELSSRLAAHVRGAKAELLGSETRRDSGASKPSGPRWSIKVDRPGALAAFGPHDPAVLADVEEVVIGVDLEPADELAAGLERVAALVGQGRVRLALPVITRGWEEGELRSRIEMLRADGWSKWEASNPSAWTFLDTDPLGTASGHRGIDLSADWPLYVLNRAAAAQLIGMGASRFTLSPEDGLENMRGILAAFGERAVVIVHQDTPLFVSETCARANLHGCPGPDDCGSENVRLVSGHPQETVVITRACRTVAVNARPFSIADRLEELGRAGAVHLRADFAWRDYSPEEILARWRTVRAGERVPGAHAANFDRGLE